MWEWEGGVPQGSLTGRTWVGKGSNTQKMEGMGIQRKNWSSFSRLYVLRIHELPESPGRWCQRKTGLQVRDYEILGRSQTLWATFPLQPMSIMARYWFCMKRSEEWWKARASPFLMWGEESGSYADSKSVTIIYIQRHEPNMKDWEGSRPQSKQMVLTFTLQMGKAAGPQAPWGRLNSY